MAKTHVGLVGCGGWGRHILRDLHVLGCEVHVVARSERTRERALQGGAGSVVASVDALPSVTGVVVAVPTSSHADIVEQLLPRQVPIFCEKALTDGPADAQRLARLAGERLFVMDKWRYHPGIEALRELARSEELGPVRGLATKRLGWGNPHPDVDAVWILAPHDLSIALEILGEVPPALGAVAEEMEGELWGLNAWLGAEPWLTVEVSASSKRRIREVRLVCEDGVAWLPDAASGHIGIGRPPFDQEPGWLETSTEMPLLRELRAFVEHLGGGAPPRSSAAEGAEIVLRVSELRALAAQRTAESEASA